MKNREAAASQIDVRCVCNDAMRGETRRVEEEARRGRKAGERGPHLGGTAHRASRARTPPNLGRPLSPLIIRLPSRDVSHLPRRWCAPSPTDACIHTHIHTPHTDARLHLCVRMQREASMRHTAPQSWEGSVMIRSKPFSPNSTRRFGRPIDREAGDATQSVVRSMRT